MGATISYVTNSMPQRMGQRLADWGGLWKIRQDNTPSPRPSLQQAAQQQAATIEPLTQGMLQRVLKALPDRASGPDAVSTQMLKSKPWRAQQSFQRNCKCIWSSCCQRIRGWRDPSRSPPPYGGFGAVSGSHSWTDGNINSRRA